MMNANPYLFRTSAQVSLHPEDDAPDFPLDVPADSLPFQDELEMQHWYAGGYSVVKDYEDA